MKNFNRREVCAGLSAVAITGMTMGARMSEAQATTAPAAAPAKANGLAQARVFRYADTPGKQDGERRGASRDDPGPAGDGGGGRSARVGATGRTATESRTRGASLRSSSSWSRERSSTRTMARRGAGQRGRCDLRCRGHEPLRTQRGQCAGEVCCVPDQRRHHGIATGAWPSA